MILAFITFIILMSCLFYILTLEEGEIFSSDNILDSKIINSDEECKVNIKNVPYIDVDSKINNVKIKVDEDSSISTVNESIDSSTDLSIPDKNISTREKTLYESFKEELSKIRNKDNNTEDSKTDDSVTDEYTKELL